MEDLGSGVAFCVQFIDGRGMTSSCPKFLLEVDQREDLLLIALSLLWVRFDRRLLHAIEFCITVMSAKLVLYERIRFNFP